MADAVLLISVICTMAFGYYIMCCVDRSFDSAESMDSPAIYENKDALLYKGSYEVFMLLEKHNLTYDIVDYPSLPAFRHYQIVFGLSESDLDNMLICANAKRVDSYTMTIAKCNAQIYREVFMRDDVDKVIFDIGQAEAVLNEWKVI